MLISQNLLRFPFAVFAGIAVQGSPCRSECERVWDETCLRLTTTKECVEETLFPRSPQTKTWHDATPHLAARRFLLLWRRHSFSTLWPLRVCRVLLCVTSRKSNSLWLSYVRHLWTKGGQKFNIVILDMCCSSKDLEEFWGKKTFCQK